jgi:excisionase family DNA binding protein
MGAIRANPNAIKLHRSYSIRELAQRLGVHKNTIRHWQSEGLESIDSGRPVLFHGTAVRAFLTKRNASRKRPCPPGTLYCFRCRAPRAPALGMIEYAPLRTLSGNLKAICGTCEAMMHRSARKADLAAIMPGLDVQIRVAEQRLTSRSSPTLNCDIERR